MNNTNGVVSGSGTASDPYTYNFHTTGISNDHHYFLFLILLVATAVVFFYAGRKSVKKSKQEST